ncbi:MAG: site-specific recombinase [Proteobacteria bacterium]|nr:site-specific recombinase [Pseudomonadota bacterium]
MSRRQPELAELLAALDCEAPAAQRHLQLIALLDWVRGDDRVVEGATGRVAQLVQAAQDSPELRARLQAWWAVLTRQLDITTLLADFGFAQRTSMASELAERLRYKLLPTSPDTLDASELFMLALPHGYDARWLAALDEALIERLLAVLVPTHDGDDAGAGCANAWQRDLLDAISYCAGQILANGFAPELRLRMSEQTRAEQPFHVLLRDAESLRVEVLHPLREGDRLQQAAQRLREHLDACRAAAASVYTHFEDEGVSVGLVFRLRQLRERILRVRALLECLLSPHPAVAATRLMAQLVLVGRERRSLRALVSANSSLLAAKMAERSAETGEHYITRTGAEYLAMVRQAAGGGLVMAFTTLAKFGLYALALSAFWGGFMAGVNYALSFVLIQLLHFTVATKQPAMTAPAMAAKLKELDDDAAVESFVDKVTQLVRSQVAAVLGNVLLVFPAALALAWLIGRALGRPAIDAPHAMHTLDALHLLGPSLLFAAFTGVLLFASSVLAGWVENWFVLHRLHSALRYNPRITRALGPRRAAHWARFLRRNISGLAANISLGFMLGLAPAFAAFFGLGLEVRHVTLTTGQIGVAAATLGTDVLQLPAFWWAVALVPFNGALNVIVSFYLAFTLALRAHNLGRVDRKRIYRALRARWRRAPLSFFAPTRGSV